MFRKLFVGLNKYIPNFASLRLTKRATIPIRDMEDLSRVYVNHVQDEDVMKISFVYGSADRSSREFNFLRSKNEKLDAGIVRIRTKIEMAMISKSNKKGKKTKIEEPAYQLSPLEIKVLNSSGIAYAGDTMNIDAWTSDSKLKINETVYDIVENGPTVSFLSLPKNIMAGFPVYPKICLEYSTKEGSLFTWYRLITKSQKEGLDEELLVTDKRGHWLQVARSFFYVTTLDDVGCKLRLECCPANDTGNFGKKVDVISDSTVLPGPGKCPFEKRHQHTRTLTSVGETRCVSYNILADLYADSDTARNMLFAYCPAEYLDFEYRKQLYLKEILGYNGDIVCLQEVDRKVFNYDLIPVLSESGLSGIFNEKGGQVAEGLACFYRTSKFKVTHSEAIILGEEIQTNPIFECMWSKVQENEKLTERLINRTTALQVVSLECSDLPRKRILLGNTHLYFHPESDNIRLIQASLCIIYLESVYKKLQEEDPSSTTALVLTGDFNSCPEFGVLKLMTEGLIPDTYVDWKSNPEEEVSGFTISHSLTLGSACGTPVYTNYTKGFQGCLDYIFYDESSLEVTDVVPFPLHKDVTEYVALPSKMFPSDHLALICTLKWK